MIESHVAKSGDLIFDVDRRQLCSHHDPRLEAKNWSERRLSEGLNAKHLIIVGLGCGYHVEALKKLTNKKIYVVEASKEILTACAKVHSMDFANFNARYIPDIQAIKESAWMQEAMSASYQVLVYKPSFFSNRDSFEPIYDWLIARNWPALAWMWEQRTQTALINQLQQVVNSDSNQLTLKDVDSLVEKSSLRGHSRSWMILRALRELIT